MKMQEIEGLKKGQSEQMEGTRTLISQLKNGRSDINNNGDNNFGKT
jgi:hypothetical protein